MSLERPVDNEAALISQEFASFKILPWNRSTGDSWKVAEQASTFRKK